MRYSVQSYDHTPVNIELQDVYLEKMLGYDGGPPYPNIQYRPFSIHPAMSQGAHNYCY